jgi:hypothetical protein
MLRIINGRVNNAQHYGAVARVRARHAGVSYGQYEQCGQKRALNAGHYQHARL